MSAAYAILEQEGGYRMLRVLLGVVTLVLFLGSVSSAAPIAVSSYSMLNGGTGSYNYRDFTYTPCNGCDVTSAPLSGGTGKLTDGVSPLLSWNQQGWETDWVGWQRIAVRDPTATFYFSDTVHLDSVTVWLDNSVGNGGVYAPASISIGGHNFLLDGVAPGPKAYTFAVDLTASSVDVQFFHPTFNSWMMVGEVSFDGGQQPPAVPEPASLLLLATGLAGMRAAMKRRR